jgi:hypothetical protein
MITNIVQIAFTNAEMSLFADFGEEEALERRIFRVVGKLSMDDRRGRVDVSLEAAQPSGWSRAHQAGYVDFSERGWEAGVVMPATLFERVEKAFFADKRLRLVLTISLARENEQARRGVVTACSVLFNTDIG